MQHSNKRERPPLSVVLRPIAALKLDPRNPRQHSNRQINQLANSIREFGFNVPILVDSDCKVVAGHGRALAARKLGLSEVPTLSLDHLTEAQARAFAIADNKLTDNSTWDDKLLAHELKALASIDLDLNLEVTGFDMGEIDFRIEGLCQPDQPESFPISDPSGAVTAQAGDLWMLGDHKVYCGNTLDPNSFQQLMGGEKAAMAFTDPPYNVPIDGHASGLGVTRHREFAMASGEMGSRQFTEFLTAAFVQFKRNCIKNSIHFACMDWRHSREILSAGDQVYDELKNVCVWTKHNAGMGSLYRSQHEFVFVFKSGRGAHRNNIQLGRHGRQRSNVWNYQGANTFGRSGEEGPLITLHPTVKPVPLVADSILDCSSRGELVLDGFLGSGTTIIAAERTGRRCYGIEIDPIYVDTIIRRWQAYSGDTAKLAGTGLSFDEKAQKGTEKCQKAKVLRTASAIKSPLKNRDSKRASRGTREAARKNN